MLKPILSVAAIAAVVASIPMIKRRVSKDAGISKEPAQRPVKPEQPRKPRSQDPDEWFI